MRPERDADHSPPSSAAVMEEYSNTSTHPLGHTGPVTGSLYLLIMYIKFCWRNLDVLNYPTFPFNKDIFRNIMI